MSSLHSPVLVCALALATHAAYARDNVSDLLATLSSAKAQTEGRALRVQACVNLRGSRALEALISKYEDARNPYNGRIDAWIYILRTRRAVSVEDAVEPQKLQASFARLQDFIESSDRALVKAGCPMKVFWKEVVVAAITVGPAIYEGISGLLKRSDASDKERDEFMKALDERKIREWRNTTSYFVYDWSSETILATDSVTAETLRKGSTSVYVNMWALQRDPGPYLVVNKEPPQGIGDSYLLYTGKLDAIPRYTGVTK